MVLKNIIRQILKFLTCIMPIYGYAILLWLLLEAAMNADFFSSQLEQSMSVWLLVISSACLLMLYIQIFENCYATLCHGFKKYLKRAVQLEAATEPSRAYKQTLKGRAAKLERLVQKKAFIRQAIAPFIHKDIIKRQKAGEKLAKLSHAKIADFIRNNYEDMPSEVQACFVKLVSPEIQQQENVYSKEVYDEYKKILEGIILGGKQL
jgi:hypothetical protein